MIRATFNLVIVHYQLQHTIHRLTSGKVTCFILRKLKYNYMDEEIYSIEYYEIDI